MPRMTARPRSPPPTPPGSRSSSSEKTATPGSPPPPTAGSDAPTRPGSCSSTPIARPAATWSGASSPALAGCSDPSRVAVLTPRLMRAAGPDLAPTQMLDAAGMMVTRSGRHFDRGAGTTDTVACGRSAWVFGGTGAAALYRRRALDDVAYPESEFFAETFFAYREDAELAWRLQLRGWRCLYVPEAMASHRRGFPTRRRTARPPRHQPLFGAQPVPAPRPLRRCRLAPAVPAVVAGAGPPGDGRLSDRGTTIPAGARRCVESCAAMPPQKRRWVLGRRTVSGRRMARWFRKQGWVEEVEVP